MNAPASKTPSSPQVSQDQAQLQNGPETASSAVEVAALEHFASRICHDLISPIGAVVNGIELLEEIGAADENSADSFNETRNFLTHASGQASAKLRALRMAYGAGGHDPNLKPEDVQKTFAGLIAADGKIRQAWDPHGQLGPDPLPPGYCKMLLCGLMLAAEFLPKGGKISVDPDGTAHTLITASSGTILIRDEVQDALAGNLDIEHIDPRMIHPYTFGLLSRHYGYSVVLTHQNADKSGSEGNGEARIRLGCPVAV